MLHYGQFVVTYRMERYGIIAHPVKHSLTPAMYGAAFRALGMDAVCDGHDVLPEKLEAFFRDFRADPQWKGLAVSFPLKEEIIPFLDSLDPIAAEIGAVNTIRVGQDGKLEGFNTDWIGITKALEGRELAWKKVLIVGARGLARAAIYALKTLGMHVSIMNRTEERAQNLAQHFHVDYLPYDFSGTDAYDLVVNATAVGSDSYTSPVPIDFWENHGNGIAFDAIYRPIATRFTDEASRAGWNIIPGYDMLAHQAVPQFEILTGKTVDVSLFQSTIEENKAKV